MRSVLRLLIILLFLSSGIASYAQHRKTVRKKSPSAVIKQDFIPPHFPGGDDSLHIYLRNRIRYPSAARENELQGRVNLLFFINEEGRPEDIQITKDIGAGCGREAIRVVQSMPDWTPGTYKGKKTRMLYELPVTFKIDW
jgi:TonB family protein